MPASAQDPLVILTPSVEVDIPEDSQQVPPLVGNSSQSNKFPFCPRFIEDKELDEAWGKISDRQAKTGDWGTACGGRDTDADDLAGAED